MGGDICDLFWDLLNTELMCKSRDYHNNNKSVSVTTANHLKTKEKCTETSFISNRLYLTMDNVEFGTSIMNKSL
jgi:hypothetical protein